MKFQKTISKEVSLVGTGLHTGVKSKITFKPHKVDGGIIFIRKDLPPPNSIKLSINYVINDKLAISIGNEFFTVSTIEHILATLAGLEIDNIKIELEAAEPPILDGSSLPFVEALKNAGIVQQEKVLPCYRLEKPVWVCTEDKHIIALPSDDFKITYTLGYENKILKSQSASFVINEEIFIKKIAPARTFCFLEDIEHIQMQGLGKGGSLENTLVLTKEGYLNNLRFEDECVRHKILDLMGALYLLGRPIKTQIVVRKSGHYLDLFFVRKMIRALA